MRRTFVTGTAVAVLGGLSGVGWPKDEGGTPKGEDVAFAAADGVALAATWWASGDPKGPAVVLVPAADADRGSLLPLVPELLGRRLAVLSLDPRGQGGSARQKGGDLGAQARSGDAGLLRATAQDLLAAALWLAKAKGRDPSRIGVLAVGRSTLVTLDAAGRAPAEFRAVVGLSPEAQAPGLDGNELAKAIPSGVAVLLVAHRDDDALGANALSAALLAARAGKAGAAFLRLRALDTPRPEDAGGAAGWFHGLDLLAHVPLLPAYVGGFLARELGVSPNEALLDGDVAEESDPGKGGAWTKATRIPAEGGAVFAYRSDRRLVFGGTMAPGFKYLEVKLRISAPGFDWAKLSRGVIDLREAGKSAVAAVLWEAPEAQVRTHTTSWSSVADDDPGDGSGGGASPGAPGLPPGTPRQPVGFGGGGRGTPFHVVFRPQGSTFTFEGQVVVPDLRGAKVPKAELNVGWTDTMPGMPTHIPLGPLPPIDMSGPWTDVPAR